MAVGSPLQTPSHLSDPAAQRALMVARQIERRGVRDERVLEAMREVPREAFVPEELAEFAYDDTPLPIAAGQTISQPYVVGWMLDAAEVEPGDRVLDVGTGSGYAAAVLSRIADTVSSIERCPELVESARAAFRRLGYDNIEGIEGDGTLGWPEKAPFDVILVAAGGPDAPEALIEQLAPGGRLIIPIGPQQQHQELTRIRKDADGAVHREQLGAVAFVPLVGEQGWRDPRAEVKARNAARAGSKRAAPIGEVRSVRDTRAMIREHAEPLPEIGDPAFARMFDRIGDARVVLLGESTHGTSEFYRARAEITRRLIEEHGFDMICVEADWPDAAGIDRHVRGLDGRAPDEKPFARFPCWMWQNREVRDFVDWLKRYNDGRPDPAHRVSFHGLDLYSLHTSIRAVLDYLDRVDPEAAAVARERYGCLSPWEQNPATYGRAALSRGFEGCGPAVNEILRDLLAKRLDYAEHDGESFVDAAQNARLVAAAEEYYRAIYHGAAESWNLRDRHMFDTLNSMMAARGPGTKAVVWAHNSHIGDAAATEMGRIRDEINIGQLARERFGPQAILVGFGTDRGTVAAATDWDGPTEIKQVRPAIDGSYEGECRDARTGHDRMLLDLRPGVFENLRQGLELPRLERAIGVIYRPQTELASHYFEASLPDQFDLYVWFEETGAVEPLEVRHLEGVPDTYPFAL